MAYLENNNCHNRNSNLPGLEVFKGIYSIDKKSHESKVTKIYQTTKYLVITRFQREYEIEFCFDDSGKVEFWSIDGNTDVEDTYSESFLNDIEDKILIVSSISDDNDEEYDNHFQNQ